MKKTMVLLFTTFTAAFSFGQIDDNLKEASWEPLTEKVIYGHTILKHEGENDPTEITNIGYKTFEQSWAEQEKEGNKEMWTAEKKKEKMVSYTELTAGGVIYPYFTRRAFDDQNPEIFTIIVRDSTDTDSNEIYREELVNKLTANGGYYWSDISPVYIPKKIKGKIYVYVIDKKHGKDITKFKFEVKL